jgi:uncharacterized membrane protein YgaE (UPF0421/DUF939 family)
LATDREGVPLTGTRVAAATGIPVGSATLDVVTSVPGAQARARLSSLMVDLWPVLQQSAAATIAWLVATHVVQHHQPFFAPIAAVVALNTPLGERGTNAVRLLVGVLAGVVAGELALHLLGSGAVALALGSFAAITAARFANRTPLVRAQAAAAAILTVVTTTTDVGPQRLVDALIGAGVALVFSQLLFPPEPVALVRRAASAALGEMAQGLRLAGRAVRTSDEGVAEQAVQTLRELRDRLGELARTRRASQRVVRHSILWRTRKAPVVRETENAGYLDLLGSSCLLLSRTVLDVDTHRREAVALTVDGLADDLAELANDPGSKDVRQRTAEHVLELLDAFEDPADGAIEIAVRMVAFDILAFAGWEPDHHGTP